jgi:beta-amylase
LSKNQSLGSFGSVGSFVDESSRESRSALGVNASFGTRDNRPSGYDRVMAVAKSCGASVTFTCAEMSDREHDPEHKCGPEGLMRQVVRCAARHGVDVAAENALYRCDATAFKQMVRNCKRGGGETEGAGMTSFTFLRMCDSLFEERNFREFATFVGDLSGNDARAGSP